MQGNFLHRFSRRFGSFADRLGNFIRFAEAYTDRAIVIAGNDQSAKTKTTTTFHNFRAAIDEHHFFRGIAPSGRRFVGVAVGASAWILLCHDLKFQTTFACRVRESFHFSVVQKSSAIEDDAIHLFREKALGNGFPNHLRVRAVGRDL